MYVRSIGHALLAAAAAIVCATALHAQTVEDWRATEKGAEKPKPKPEQSYHGVTPGSGNSLPRVEELKNRPGTWVTWPGFTMKKDGGSRVFLQTTLTLEYAVDKTTRPAAKKLVLDLKEAQVYTSNNHNPLVTTYFNTPVRRVYLKKKGKTLNLIIELRVKKEPEISQKTDEDGYHYLFIDFPKGDYAEANPKDARPALEGYGKRGPDQEEAADDLEDSESSEQTEDTSSP